MYFSNIICLLLSFSLIKQLCGELDQNYTEMKINFSNRIFMTAILTINFRGKFI